MQTFQVQIPDTDFQRSIFSGSREKTQVLQEKIQQFGQLLIWLDELEQKSLFKALRRQILLAEAERLGRSVKPNPINMEAIVEEVRQVRAARHEAG